MVTQGKIMNAEKLIKDCESKAKQQFAEIDKVSYANQVKVLQPDMAMTTSDEMLYPQCLRRFSMRNAPSYHR